MPCVAYLAGDARIAYRICLLAAAFSALPVAFAYAADLNRNLNSGPPLIVAQASNSKTPKAAPPASPMAPNATGAEIVGKMLAPRPSDPDVPLPRGDLAARPADDGSRDGPTVYGRQEEGGGVFGLKIPIPADRAVPDRHTRPSTGAAGSN